MLSKTEDVGEQRKLKKQDSPHEKSKVQISGMDQIACGTRVKAFRKIIRDDNFLYRKCFYVPIT